jgi:hypothetical protein
MYDNVEVRVLCEDHPVSTKGSLVVLNRDAMMNYFDPVFDIYDPMNGFGSVTYTNIGRSKVKKPETTVLVKCYR